MKVLIILLLAGLLPTPVIADDNVATYCLQNVTKSLLSLDQKVIDMGMDIVFSSEEQEELKGIVNSNNSLEIVRIQERLLENGKIPEISTRDEGLHDYDHGFSYSECVEAQNFIAMNETFYSIDFLLKQCIKIEDSINTLQETVK